MIRMWRGKFDVNPDSLPLQLKSTLYCLQLRRRPGGGQRLAGVPGADGVQVDGRHDGRRGVAAGHDLAPLLLPARESRLQTLLAPIITSLHSSLEKVFGVVFTVKVQAKFPEYTWIVAAIGVVLDGCSCFLIPWCTNYFMLMLPICILCFGIAMVDTALLPTLGYIVDKVTRIIGLSVNQKMFHLDLLRRNT